MDVALAGLDPAARLAAAEGIAEQPGPVGDGAEQVAHVDEVEGVVRPRPLLGAVVDLELDVRWYPYGLCGRQVRPYDFCVGVLVTHVAAVL